MAGGAGLPAGLIEPATRLQAACIGSGVTVATAESCTGGLVGAAISEIPGASSYYLGGVVAYSNRAKETLLEVPGLLLAAHGAVSPEAAAAMATGARTRFDAEIAVSVTGIAGPTGGTAVKPVGLVWIGLADRYGVATRSWVFPGDRAAVRRSAAIAALDWLAERAGAPSVPPVPDAGPRS
jgi:nicotinamide-nucleotide amidase